MAALRGALALAAGRDRGDAQIGLVLELLAGEGVSDGPRAVDHHRDLAVLERRLHVLPAVGGVRLGGPGVDQLLDDLHGLDAGLLVDRDALALGVDQVAALAVEEGQEPVRVVAAQVEAGLAGLVLDLLRDGLQLVDGRGHLDAGVLEDLLVVEEAHRVDDLRHRVRLAVVLGTGRGLRQEVLVVLERGGAVQRCQVAEVRELGGPGDLGADHVGGAGAGLGGVLELVLRLTERHVDVLDVDARVLLLEALRQLLEDLVLTADGRGVPPGDGAGQLARSLLVTGFTAVSAACGRRERQGRDQGGGRYATSHLNSFNCRTAPSRRRVVEERNKDERRPKELAKIFRKSSRSLHRRVLTVASEPLVRQGAEALTGVRPHLQALPQGLAGLLLSRCTGVDLVVTDPGPAHPYERDHS